MFMLVEREHIMKISQCTLEKYPAMLNTLDESFSNDPGWFTKNLPHCTPFSEIATPEEIAQHLICEIDGEIAGVTGVYPLDWVIDGKVVPAYGIGQVCCLPKFRQRGVMSALQKAAEAVMLGQGRVLGMLGGDRRRYGFFGYDFGGNKLAFYLKKKYLVPYVNGTMPTIRTAQSSDAARLKAAYNHLPARILRSERHWFHHFSRQNGRWLVGELDGRYAYVGYVNPNEIHEIYGDASIAAAMLLHIIAHENEGKYISVYYPMQNANHTDMGRMLYDLASNVEVQPLDLLSVIDADGLLDVLEIDTSHLDTDKRKALAQRLVGFVHRPLPVGLEMLEKYSPLCVWKSAMDDI